MSGPATRTAGKMQASARGRCGAPGKISGTAFGR
jgi:hypothetical protein